MARVTAGPRLAIDATHSFPSAKSCANVGPDSMANFAFPQVRSSSFFAQAIPNGISESASNPLESMTRIGLQSAYTIQSQILLHNQSFVPAYFAATATNAISAVYSAPEGIEILCGRFCPASAEFCESSTNNLTSSEVFIGTQ